MAKLKATTVTPNLSATGTQYIMPIGGIIAWWTASIPANFLLCDGSAISRGTYSKLFTIISTTYGPGDGSTTFNLPNLVGKHAYGNHTEGLGVSGGNLDHVHTVAAHTHSLNNHTHDLGNHTHTMSSHTHNLGNHTHTMSSHTHDLANHSHTGVEHGHTVTSGGPNSTVNRRTGVSTAIAPNNHTHTGTIPNHSANLNAPNTNVTGTNNDATSGPSTASGTNNDATSGPSTNTSGVNNSNVSDGGNGNTGANNAPFMATNFIMRYQ